jgi:catechol 2,3-dioxygenase-like lactoylglutathione lyase family enzyme
MIPRVRPAKHHQPVAESFVPRLFQVRNMFCFFHASGFDVPGTAAGRLGKGHLTRSRNCSSFVPSRTDWVNGESNMIGYVTIGALDVEASLPFFDAIFGAIEHERSFFQGGWAGYGPKGADADTYICPPFDGEPARGGNGIMIAFLAPSKEAVEAAYQAALANGGQDEGAPGQGLQIQRASMAPISGIPLATSSVSSPRPDLLQVGLD